MKRIVLAGMCLVLLAACDRSLISGTVVNVKGEALPGVAVHVEGTHYQALTDGRGEYRLPYVPGHVVLQFMKTGYTPGTLEIAADTRREITATTVALWELPLDKGVYLYENFRYRETTAVVPEEFVSNDQRKVYATRRWPEVETSATAPLVLCYKMPDWDVRFCRMDLAELSAPVSGGGLDDAPVLARTRTIPARLAAVDQPEGLLRQLELPGPLEPGTYAVHWGALDGAAARDPRIFMFSVVDFILTMQPESEEEALESDDEAREAEDTADPPAADVPDGA